jgi:Flp pilus assembly pilin Flp
MKGAAAYGSRVARGWQRGAAAIEFALVMLLIFVPLLLGLLDFGRWLFAWNAASEATRLGARIAVVCSPVDADPRARQAIVQRMQRIYSGAVDEVVRIEYDIPGPGCTQYCKTVTVRIEGANLDALSFFLPAMGIPESATTLSRESLSSDNNFLCRPTTALNVTPSDS